MSDVTFDLGPAAEQMSRLVAAVGEHQLGDPSPCQGWTVADLLAHVHQFATVFTHNARKQPGAPPESLVHDWRVAVPAQLRSMAVAWGEDSAWQGRVSAGGVEMDASDNAVVGIEELTVHGWDLAHATGQDFDVDQVQLDQVERFFDLFAEQIAAGAGPFGPPKQARDGAARWERVLARTGRDPAWTPGS